MMKLQNLEISGFKSFVDPVVTDFAGGITAIVGPNGCGKSNLSEAVTWVLGEQSAKSLRGGTMEDVIFNGSEGRRPLGMAEVTLTLAVDSGFPTAEDGRIRLGRRVFRTGESQYRLNGRVVRLKQIKDLLMDTGLGIRAYSVIEQGRIGMILSGKPQDRRKLLEEAAGITRYKARKRVAEVKLEEAMANLLRLEDVIGEVERSLRSLKRQANAARRYRDREVEYKELLAKVLLARWMHLDRRLRELASELGVATEREAELTAALHRDEAQLVAAREQLEKLAQELSERHRREAQLAATIEGRQELLKGARQTLQEISERFLHGQRQAEAQGRELDEHTGTLSELESRAGVLASERDEAAAAVDKDRHEISRANDLLREKESQAEALRGRLLTSMGELTRIQSQLHQQQIEGEKGNYRQEHLSQELASANRALEEAEGVVEQTRGRVRELEGAVAETEASLAQLKTSLEESLADEGKVNVRRQDLQKRLHVTEQRRAVLKELAEADVERRAQVKEALESLELPEPRFLADELRVPPGWENSLDLYLEAIEDAVLVPPGTEPLELARALSASRSQAALLRPLEEAPDATSRALEDPAIVRPLGEALGLSRGLAAALPPAYLVRSREDAERLAREHSGCAFISSDRLWAQGGILHLQGEESRPGILARNRELADLEEEIPSLEDEISQASRELEALVEERTRLAGEVHRLENVRADRRQELAVAQARAQDALHRHARAQEQHSDLVTEEERIRRDLAATVERQEALRKELSEAQSRHSELEGSFDAAQAAVAQAREQREAQRTEGAGRQGRLDLLEERVESHGNEVRRLKRQREELQFQLQRWNEEEHNLAQRRQDLLQAMEQAEAELQEALEKRDSSLEETLAGEDRLEAHRGNVRAVEEQVEQLRKLREEVQSEVQELRITQASLSQEAGHLKSNYQQEFRQPVPDISPAEPESELDLAVLEEELERKRAVLERMGPVNVLAAEEYTEQEERHQFLYEQRADVAGSVERLRKTIREINETSSLRFRETFDAVNQSFGTLFTELFRGGEAEMRLLDEEDLLESGIEIVARPPGKRHQNIMLLSGGEKALTAIALLFALFRNKPSPFCILDEVDAPLDDSNILRFVELLKTMAQETQFLVITHNKLTMEVASTLYGVTMEEKGVSKLVAVELDDLHPLEEQLAVV